MTPESLYPLLFEPALRDYVWGGRNLETLLGRTLPPGPIAESWEISGHADAPTRVLNGSLRGQTLPDLVKVMGVSLLGTRGMSIRDGERFPLLIKLLDAQRDLSVQVHPDDEYASEHLPEEGGKVECWYILAAREGATVIYGLQPGVDRASLRRAVESDAIEPLLNHQPVRPGDCVFVPAGTVHALLAGTLCVEVQQTSDATFRLYDWGRLGNDGRPRELHIDNALEVISWGTQGPGVVEPAALPEADGVRRSLLVRSPQFVLEKIELAPGAIYDGLCLGETFEIWGCVEGQANLTLPEPVGLEAVRFVLLPARMGAFRIAAGSQSTLLRAYLGPRVE